MPVVGMLGLRPSDAQSDLLQAFRLEQIRVDFTHSLRA